MQKNNYTQKTIISSHWLDFIWLFCMNGQTTGINTYKYKRSCILFWIKKEFDWHGKSRKWSSFYFMKQEQKCLMIIEWYILMFCEFSGTWSTKVTSTTERSNENSGRTKVSSTTTENTSTTTVRSGHKQRKLINVLWKNFSVLMFNIFRYRVSPFIWIHSTVQYWLRLIKSFCS